MLKAIRHFSQCEEHLHVGNDVGQSSHVVGDLSRDGFHGYPGGSFSEVHEILFFIMANEADDVACGAFAAALYREAIYSVGMLDFIVQDAPPQVVIAFTDVQWASPLPRKWKLVADRLSKLCSNRLSAGGILRGGLRAYF